MGPETRQTPLNQRLSFPQWKELVDEWLAVKSGKVDNRHGGRQDLWNQDVRRSMPLSVREPELPLYAVETQDPVILEIVYSGITPGSHVDHMHDNNLCPCQMTYEALLAFSNRFHTSIKARELGLLVRRALESDDETLFNRIPGFTERDLFYAWRIAPSLLEYTEGRMAPVMADFLQGWVKYHHGNFLSVFLDCARLGYAKTLNAMIAAGFNPYDIVASNDASFGSPAKKGLLDHSGRHGKPAYPRPFLDTLALLDPLVESSNHARLSRAALFSPGAATQILSMDPDTRCAGISACDWRAFEKNAKDRK